MELKDTVDLMLSDNYIERFQAEFHQLNIRIAELRRMLKGYREGNFNPNCPFELLHKQLIFMLIYRDMLEERAEKENIDLSVDSLF